MKKSKILSLLLGILLSTTTNVWGQEENVETFFSNSFKKGTPVLITNNRDKSFSIKFGNIKSPTGMPVKSGAASYTTDDIWYLVGNADGFKMYNHNAVKNMPLNLMVQTPKRRPLWKKQKRQQY